MVPIHLFRQMKMMWWMAVPGIGECHLQELTKVAVEYKQHILENVVLEVAQLVQLASLWKYMQAESK